MINTPVLSAELKADSFTNRNEAKSNDSKKDADLKWQKRLLSLSIDDQIKISKKYYGGSMPWK